MFFRKILFLFSILSFFYSPLVHSFSEADVPDALKPWIQWVLRGHEEALCPSNENGDKICQWPSVLDLKLDAKSGSFTQSWRLFKEDWVSLPGDEEHWPQNVKVNGQPLAVLSEASAPAVYLKPGLYQISGNFAWDALPESFRIPESTGPVNLSVNGKAVMFPRREEAGSIWLEQESKAESGEEHLELRVSRKMKDDIPFILITDLHLDVAGKSREVILGKALPAGFVPMSLSGALPARLDEQGQLRVQVKAGQWNLTLEARHEGPVTQIEWTPPPAPWPSQEIWVFEANNNLRMVNLEGVPTVDPQQSMLPDAWKKLPAYQVENTAVIKFDEKRRGDSDPAPDQLSLQRQWWLDFDGRGFTVQDSIQGELKRSWRLNVQVPLQLGRVSVNGEDQLITRLPESNQEGVEIRQGNLNISAESRLEGALRKVSAVGWDHSFQKVNATLNLPPGWRLFAVSGVDQAMDTWVNRWTLLDIFLVLMLSLAFFKLAGRFWGVLAFITLVLTYKEVDAPQWIWLFLVLGLALVKYLPEGRFKKIVKVYRYICVLILVLWSVPFMIQQLRIAIYPSLENPYQVLENRPQFYGGLPKGDAPLPPPVEPNMPAPLNQENQMIKEEAQLQKKQANIPEAEDHVGQREKVVSGMLDSRKLPAASMKKSAYYSKNLLEQRPGTKIQTGPGLPKWSWKKIDLNWSGPVAAAQKIYFMLMPPWLNFMLAFVRVILLAFLILGLLKFPGNFWPGRIKQEWGMALAFLLFMIVFCSPQNAKAEFPPENLLNELREQLLKKPACDPDCAVISRMHLDLQGNILSVRMEVNALAESSISIPGSRKDWMPSDITVNGQNFAGVRGTESGALLLQLPAGVHQVVLRGTLPDQESVSLALSQKPYFVSAQLQGWSVEGLHENGQAEDTLRLIRVQRADTQSAGKSAIGGNGNSNVFPAFAKLERNLELGLTWEVHNRVTRVGPLGSAVILEIPLLEGESVTTAGVRVNQNKVQVNMAPSATEFSWESVLTETPTLHLTAPSTNAWLETWKLEASPVWHVSWKGIPVIFNQQGKQEWIPEWMPWPGESVDIEVSRPEGVAGSTLTIDESTLDVSPGLRFTDVKLSLNIRSSLGGQHSLTLPEGAELQSLSINGQNQAIRQEGRNLVLPLVPGSQSFLIQWQQAGGIRFFFKSPEVNLGSKSVNSEIQIHISENRWLMLVWGPRMGPAVLIWSLLFVWGLASFALGKSQMAPIKFYEWVLLGIGLFQFPEVPLVAVLIVVGWLLALSWRKNKATVKDLWFNLRQILLWTWGFVAIILLFVSISQGLIGYPDMQIEGNGSTSALLRWFQDRSEALLPRPWLISLPLFVYRLSMLAWALWLAAAFIRWIKWAWTCMGEGGFWRKVQSVVRKAENSAPKQ